MYIRGDIKSIKSQLFIAARTSLLGLILSSSPYLRSALWGWPLSHFWYHKAKMLTNASACIFSCSVYFLLDLGNFEQTQCLARAKPALTVGILVFLLGFWVSKFNLSTYWTWWKTYDLLFFWPYPILPLPVCEGLEIISWGYMWDFFPEYFLQNFINPHSSTRLQPNVVKQGSSENDGRSNVYDRLEFKVTSNCCYSNCCCTNCSYFTFIYQNFQKKS